MNHTFVSASRFALRLGGLALAGTLALTACAVDADSEEPSATENVATRSDALINNGGGPRAGFSCENGVCECSKSIEGDCDRMRNNCTGGLTQLDECLKGWLTTHCTCTYGRTTSPTRPPIFNPGGGGGVLSP